MKRRKDGARAWQVMLRVAAAFLICSVCFKGVNTAAGAAGDMLPDGVLELNRTNYNTNVLKTKKIVVVYVHSSEECPPCANVLTEVGKAAVELNKYGITTGVLDVVAEKGTRAQQKFLTEIKFQGVPAVYVYHGDATPNPYGGRPMRESVMVSGTDARAIKRDAMKQLPQLVKRVESTDSTEYKTAVAQAESEWVVVALTERLKTSPMLQSLAFALEGGVAVVEVHVDPSASSDDDEDEAAPLSGVAGLFPLPTDGLPALYVFKKKSRGGGGEGSARQFEGELKDRQAVLTFVEQETGVALKSSTDKTSTDADVDGGTSRVDADEEETVVVQEDYLTFSPFELQKRVRHGKEALVVVMVPSMDEDFGAAIPGWDKSVPPLTGGGGQLLVAVIDCSYTAADDETAESGKISAGKAGKAIDNICRQVKQSGESVIRVYAHALSDIESRDEPTDFKYNELKAALSAAEGTLPMTYIHLPANHMPPDALAQTMQRVIAATIMAPSPPPTETSASSSGHGDDDGNEDVGASHSEKEGAEEEMPKMVLLVTSNKDQPNLLIKSLAAEFATSSSSPLAGFAAGGPGGGPPPPPVSVVYIAKPPADFLTQSGLPGKVPSVQLLFVHPMGHMMQQPDENMPPGSIQLTNALYTSRENGPLTFQNLKRWIVGHQNMLRKFSSQSSPFSDQDGGGGGGAGGSGSSRSAAGGNSAGSGGADVTATFEEITAENWPTLCSKESAQLCVVAVLSRASDGSGSGGNVGDMPAAWESSLAEVRAVADAARDRKGPFSKQVMKAGAVPPLIFLWADGLCQQAFTSGFEVEPDSLPGVFVYSPKRQRFAKFVGAFDSANIAEWLAGILESKISTSQVFQEPELSQVDCASFDYSSVHLGGTADGEAGDSDDGIEMEDLLAEIRAEEERQKKQLEEEVAKAMKEAELEKARGAAKKKKKKKKKKKSASGSGGAEL